MLFVLAILPILTPLIAPTDGAMFVYPHAAVGCLLSVGFCLVAGRKHPEEAFRWNLLALTQVLMAMVYVVAVAHRMHWVSDRTDSFGRALLVASSQVLLLPALMVSRTRSGVLVRVLDGALMLLACVLLAWALVGGEAGTGHARVYLGCISSVFITCAAITAQFSVDTPGLRQFSRAVVSFLVAGLIIRFLANIVFYAWLSNEWALPCNLLVGLDSLLLCEWAMTPMSPTPRRFPIGFDRNIADSLQPTWVMLGTTLLALFTLDMHRVLAASMMVVAVLLYAFRTQAFYYRMFRERSQLRNEATHLQQLATRDELTGIGNRRWFEQQATAALEDEPSSRVAVLLLDADNFKDINDRLGHFAGDEMLQWVALAMEEGTAAYPRACCARLGGDEFAALLPGLSMMQAQHMAEELCARVRSSQGVGMQATASIGVAWLENRRVSLGLLLRWADAALYRAKDDGRDCVRVIDLTAIEDAAALSKLEALPKIGREMPADVL
jgi:diguanylate cyclase (GGDEF)-like protein